MTKVENVQVERVRVFLEPRDVWVGYYRGDRHNYVCPLPCIVIRWPRRG